MPFELTPELLRELAERHGTPLHVYDAGCVRRRLAELAAFDRVRYAQKANPGLALLALVRECGATVDAVSAGEIRRALLAGFAPNAIRYTGDAFEPETLALVRERRLAVNVGSIEMLAQLAGDAACELWLRVNPGFGHGHGRKVETGGASSKHGVWHADLARAAARARELGIGVHGLHVHIGSGSDLEHLALARESLRRAAPLFADSLRAISAGGGLPVPYRPGEERFDVAAYARLWDQTRGSIAQELGREVELEVEPGRYVVAEAGVLLARVLGRKRSGEHDWVLVDAGFNDLLRPAFYGAWHDIRPLDPARGPLTPKLVAGPLCESADVFTVDRDGAPEPRLFPDLRRGDLLCIRDTGAYGSSMSSTYNSRPLAAEVLVDDGRAVLVRRRQSFEELVAGERLSSLPEGSGA